MIQFWIIDLKWSNFNFLDNGIANLTKVILQCGQPLHCWSDILKSAFAQSRKLAILKIWSWCRLYLQKYHPSLICCSARAADRQYITGLSIYYRDMTCFDGLYLKHRVCFQRCMTKYWYFTWDKRSTARRAVMVHSTRRIALILASFKVAIPSKSKKPSWIDWTIKIFPRALNILFFARSVPLAHNAFSSEPSRNLLCVTILGIISTSGCCASVLSLRGARVRRRNMSRGTERARPRSLSIVMARVESNGSLFAPPVDLISFTS